MAKTEQRKERGERGKRSRRQGKRNEAKEVGMSRTSARITRQGSPCLAPHSAGTIGLPIRMPLSFAGKYLISLPEQRGFVAIVE